MNPFSIPTSQRCKESVDQSVESVWTNNNNKYTEIHCLELLPDPHEALIGPKDTVNDQQRREWPISVNKAQNSSSFQQQTLYY
jgi:hypothetical protein